MRTTPKALRIHIAMFGRRNAGKSSLMNALTRQAVAIVSEVAGTTTDPIEKAMELRPLGPVLFIDTAGIDDEGALGAQRVSRTEQVFARTDIGVVVTHGSQWGRYEEELLARLRAHHAGVVVVFNKADLAQPDADLVRSLRARGLPVVDTAASEGRGISRLREALVRAAPEAAVSSRGILDGIVRPGELVVLVTPIDIAAPRGRLILPQVQTIRELLDNDALCMVVKESELKVALARLAAPPALVVTDSQAFARVDAETPPEVALTSFSVLFARFKGDLAELVRGTLAVDDLRPGDRVLIAEACTHHPTDQDIGRVKIPRWLREHVGGPLAIEHAPGRELPEELTPYRLVIQCGSCVLGRREVLSRIARCRAQGVPVANYGLTIAKLLGILPRAIAPFGAACSLGDRAEQCSRC